jgi:nucleotide-binding universal stress UspA family protein
MQDTARRLTGPILVGVTGAGENTEALRFALAEARTSGAPLTLVHAVHPVLPPPQPPGVLIADDRWDEIGAAVVRGARRELEAMSHGEPVEVDTAFGHGPPAAVFRELSKDAGMIVLQHRSLSRLRRIVTGATVASVAAHVDCPVVSVPAVEHEPSGTDVITVGVQGDGGPPEVLEAAFAAAAVHGCSLRVVHGWRLEPAYDDIIAARDAMWSPDIEANLEAATSVLRARYPDVAVKIEVHHRWPADALVQAANDSRLLVIGRHRGLPALPTRLGSLARAAVEHARRPVLIVPTGATARRGEPS